MHTSENKYLINTQLFLIHTLKNSGTHKEDRVPCLSQKKAAACIWRAINIPSLDHLFWVSTVSSSDLWAGSDFLWPCWSLVASRQGYLCRKCLWWSSRGPRCRPWTQASRRMPCASEQTISSGGAFYSEVLAFWTSVPTAWRRNMKILMSGEDGLQNWNYLGVVLPNQSWIIHKSLSNHSWINLESLSMPW